MADHRRPADTLAPASGRTLAAGPLVILSIAGAAFSTILSQSSFAPFLPFIAESLGTSVALVGQAPAATMLLAGLLGLVVGPLADRYGQRRALLIGLLGTVVSSLGIGLAHSYAAFIGVMLVGAIGRATILPVSMVVGGTRFAGDAQRRALSWMSTGLVAATILGVPLLAFVGSLVGWRGAYVVLATICAGAAFLVWRGLGPDSRPSTAPFRLGDLLAPYGTIARHRPTVLFLMASLVANIGLWNVQTYIGAYWISQHGLTLNEIGLVALIQGLGGLAGSWLMSTPVGRISPRLLMAISRFGTAIFSLVPFVLPIPTVLAAASFTCGYVLNGMGAIGTTLVLANAPTPRATTLTLNGAAWSFGIALGAASGGLALTLSGYAALGLCAFATMMVGGALILYSDVLTRRANSRPGVTAEVPVQSR